MERKTGAGGRGQRELGGTEKGEERTLRAAGSVGRRGARQRRGRG